MRWQGQRGGTFNETNMGSKVAILCNNNLTTSCLVHIYYLLAPSFHYPFTYLCVFFIASGPSLLLSPNRQTAKMFSKLALSLSLLSLLNPVSAVTWYFLTYYPASGAYFTEFSGSMVVPTLPAAATYYLWPGLQPTDGSGVYQNVLDGRSGTWYFGSGWCCSNPTLAWGSGFNTYAGETNTFSNVRVDDTNWQTTIVHGSTGTTDVNTFALADKSFNQAIFAIEL